MRECGGETLTEITYLVLLAFCRPNHGYGVLQFLKNSTGERLQPGAGTLYGVVNALLKKGWISLCEQDERKKIYVITGEGRQVLERETERLRQISLLGREILDGGFGYGEE